MVTPSKQKIIPKSCLEGKLFTVWIAYRTGFIAEINTNGIKLSIF